MKYEITSIYSYQRDATLSEEFQPRETTFDGMQLFMEEDVHSEILQLKPVQSTCILGQSTGV